MSSIINTAAGLQSPLTVSPRRKSTVRSIFLRKRLKDIILKNIDKIEEIFAYSTGRYIEPSTGFKRVIVNKGKNDATQDQKKPDTFFSFISKYIISKKHADTGLKEQIEKTNQGDSIWAMIKCGKVDEVSSFI